MEANELMVGDWVSLDGEPIKVEGVYKHSHKYRVNDDNVCADCCRPIPLTAGMLEANGATPDNGVFRMESGHGEGGCLLFFEEYRNAYSLTIDMEIDAYGEPREHLELPYLHYVHELQHALRLCGFSGMADNFRLE